MKARGRIRIRPIRLDRRKEACCAATSEPRRGRSGQDAVIGAHVGDWSTTITHGEAIPGIEYEYKTCAAACPDDHAERTREQAREPMDQRRESRDCRRVAAVKDGVKIPTRAELLAVLTSVRRRRRWSAFTENLSSDALLANARRHLGRL